MTSSNTRCFVVDGPGVPIEPQALDQLRAVAARSDCVRAVGQPDLHAGPGQPIGASFGMRSLWPRLVGSDAGCGVRVSFVRGKSDGDKLLRRVDAAFDERMVHSAEVHEAAWRGGVRALAGVSSLPEKLRALASAEPEDDLPTSGDAPELANIDSIGGGNHFAEISAIDEISDRQAAKDLGIDRRGTAIVVHSGSRSVGAQLSERYGMETLEAGQQAGYLADLAGAVRFAAANRFLLSWRLMVALGATKAPLRGFDVVHNTVVPFELGGESLLLHRKGCAPAEASRATVVLGSRGAPSWILRGWGNTALLSSVAHGAGRRMTRSDARDRFRAKYKRRGLERTAHGGVVLCDRKELLFEEHPDAYKAIGPVVDALQRHELAGRVASLLPRITVKR